MEFSHYSSLYKLVSLLTENSLKRKCYDHSYFKWIAKESLMKKSNWGENNSYIYLSDKGF